MPRRRKTVTMTEPEAVQTEASTTFLNAGRNGLFESGAEAEIVADIFPARITPRPAMLPGGVAKFRAVVTDQFLTVAWPGGYQNGVPTIYRIDLPLIDSAQNASFRGGEVTTTDAIYTVERGNGCSCGAAGLKNWHPFPNVRLRQRGTQTQVSPGQQVRYSNL